MSTLESPAAEGKRKWISWTCLACDHCFRSNTRRGLTLTCPRCDTVQRGPEGVRQALAELARLQRRERKVAPGGRERGGEYVTVTV